MVVFGLDLILLFRLLWECWSWCCSSQWLLIYSAGQCFLLTVYYLKCTHLHLLSPKRDLHINYVLGGHIQLTTYFFYQYNEDKHRLKMCILQKCTDYICFCLLYICSKLQFCSARNFLKSCFDSHWSWKPRFIRMKDNTGLKPKTANV